MFIVSSTDQAAQFADLLEYYYENLSKNISELGSDPNKLFPRSKFQEQWKMFSTVGYLFSICFLFVILCDKNEAPAFSECSNEEEMKQVMMKVTPKDKKSYRERILSLSKYYFALTEK